MNTTASQGEKEFADLPPPAEKAPGGNGQIRTNEQAERDGDYGRQLLAMPPRRPREPVVGLLTSPERRFWRRWFPSSRRAG
jgi:hypothetical protein